MRTFNFIETFQSEWTKENNFPISKKDVLKSYDCIYFRIKKQAGFSFNLETKTNIRFNLRCLKTKYNENSNVSICLYKIISETQVEIIIDDDIYMSSPWGLFSKYPFN
jgi:hypothetical protein